MQYIVFHRCFSSIGMEDEINLADELPPEGPEEVMSEATIKRAAALGASGATKYAIAKALNISAYYAGKIMRDEQYKKLVEEIGDDAVANAKAKTRADLARLARKAVTAIEKNLDKHNLNAAITVLRSLGLETAKDGDGEKNSFTLVLAGQKPEPQTIVVKQKEEKK